jgi:hypothetical protein
MLAHMLPVQIHVLVVQLQFKSVEQKAAFKATWAPLAEIVYTTEPDCLSVRRSSPCRCSPSRFNTARVFTVTAMEAVPCVAMRCDMISITEMHTNCVD